jgi:hypothetical protein
MVEARYTKDLYYTYIEAYDENDKLLSKIEDNRSIKD